MIRIATVAAALMLSLFALAGSTSALQPGATSELAAPAAQIIVDTCSETTLNAALNSAVSGDTIWLRCSASGAPKTINLSSNKILAKSLTILGTHPSGGFNALDAQFASRIFNVNAGNMLTLTNIVLQDGQASGASGGGCIYAAGSLVVLTTTFTHCRTQAGSGLSGGAIYATGPVVELKNTTLFSNTADGDGGGLYAASLQPTIDGSRIDSNAAGGAGAGLYFTATGYTYPMVYDTRILSNKAQGDGGGIYADHSAMWLYASLISDNVAYGNGGGVNIAAGSYGEVWGSTFVGNDTSGSGTRGGALVNLGDVDLRDSRFTANASYYGGAIANYGAMELRRTSLDLNAAAYGAGIYNIGRIDTGTNLTFTGNVAAWNGGGFYGGAPVTNRAAFTDVVFTGNSAVNGHGGGLYAQGNVTVTLHNASVTDSNVKHNGAGLYAKDSVIKITQSSISGNRVDGTDDYSSGGGIYITGTAKLTLSDSQVNDNRIGFLGAGGGVHVYGGSATLHNVTANGNRSTGAAKGGGLYLENTSAAISGLAASGNTGVSFGGGVYARGGLVTIEGGEIRNNAASGYGGGIYMLDGMLTLLGVSVTDHGMGAANGAGIYCYKCQGGFSDVAVSRNVAADSGGGLYAYLSNVMIFRSTFDNNESNYGGGIYNDDTALALTNSTVSANRAASDGGGIYNAAGSTEPSVLTMVNVTLKDNHAFRGGALFNFIGSDTHAYITNTVLADSTGGGNCSGKHADSSGYSLSTDLSCQLTGTGNRNAHPAGLSPLALVGGLTRVHLPRTDSDLVNWIPGSTFPSTDQRGFGRPYGIGADVGSVERQLADPLYPPLLYLPLVARQ
jgi:fibronectin-binding autotransporter adhesin